jgi:ABC-type glucose/galactose transport system permease subunit
MLVVIRSGLNFVLAKYNVSVNSTYVTYVLTGVIVVFSVLIDILKNKKKK